MKQLYTRWGKKIDPEHVLSEYPRPLLVRDSYINLNGYWEYALTDAFQKPEKYDGKILVPFSPEAVLSGVNRQLQPEEYLWYKRTIDVNEVQLKKHRLILHFGAVDQACVVYVNGHQTGRHTGGYLPFELDITDAVHDGANELTVAVKDRSDTSYHAKGKQKLKAGGMFYTAQSGIWQTVWMEYVPEVYITELEAIPDIDRNVVRICVHASEPEQKCRITVHKAAIYPEAMECSEDVFDMFEIPETVIIETKGNTSAWIEIPVPDARLWTCEEPYLYYYNFGDFEIIGSSPEMIVKQTDNRVYTCPIAGTRKRGKTPQEDTALEQELLADEKERAEHVMLVDLARNDMGRIAQIGSVKVSEFMRIQRYSHVMHIVSLVEGRKKGEYHPLDLVSSFLPAGTLSGAPKIRAMEIIDELETVRRGLYGGATGYLDFGGNMNFCITIRTMIKKGEKVYLQAGAGIVADSVPENEYQECCNKVMALAKTLVEEEKL